MTRRVVVIGAGVGGLSSAIRLAREGCAVTVIEARADVGGLAAGLELDGFRFDAGPYVLLDRPGLEWAFRQLRIAPETHVPLQRISDVYQESHSGQIAFFLISQTSLTWQPRPLPPRPASRNQFRVSSPSAVSDCGMSNSRGSAGSGLAISG